MKLILKRLIFGGIAAFPLLLAADQQSEMLSDLEVIKHAFHVSYAPADWKKTFSGWDLEVEVEIAKANIMVSENISVKEFQHIVKQFLSSTKDYHVKVNFHSTEKATLPFRVKGAGGRYFFSFIDRRKLSFAAFPFSEGDELLLFNGRPVEEVILELMKEEISSNEMTDRALAEIFLTRRLGRFGQVVPNGVVSITGIPFGFYKPTSYQLIWDYKAEAVKEPPRKNAALQKSLRSPENAPLIAAKKGLSELPIFQKLLLTPFVNHLVDGEDDEDDLSDVIGARESCIPKLGRIWWKSESDCPFDAYLFELTDRKLAGYIRIPSYMPTSEFDVELFGEIISLLEERSDVLVIDQVNNPGGSVFYLHALASMLTDQPLMTPRHRMMITQSDVFTANKLLPLFEEINSEADAKQIMGESFSGIPVTHQMSQFIVNFFRFIIDQWNSGKRFTDPYYLYGMDHINPHPYIRYTKPILILVNSLDFSGGDFFPAILQDNQRVTVMGSRTAGAGGFIGSFKFPSLNGIADIRYTASIAERADKSPIENLGVTPDIPYVLTESDLQYGYIDYANAIRETLLNLLDSEE